MRRLLFLVLLLTSFAGCRTAQSTSDTGDSADRSSLAAGDELLFEGPLPRPKNVPPVSLTASDGTGLRLTMLKGRAVLDEPLAYTEVHLAFANPESRTLEGRFEITLPPGAAVSRFAMKIGDTWQEAEMVEKKRARAVYEDFLHRKQDPALLEQAAPNAFSARVFPIPARGKKEIILAYAEELAPGAGYQFPLAGLPAVDDLDVTVARAGQDGTLQERKSRGGEPLTEDLVVTPQALRGGGGVRSGRLVLARVRPVTRAQPEPFEGATLMLVDTSASRALGFAEEAALVEGLAREIAGSAGPSVRLLVAAFDQDVATIYDGHAGAYGMEATSKLIARGALGASNLENALSWAAEHANGIRRVIVVSDGVATAGETDGAKLTATARRMREAGVQRLDAIAVGGIRDEAALAHLTSDALPRDGVVADGGRDAETIARRLTRTARSGLRVEVEGASWVWPERLDGVQPGDERLVYAEMPEGAPVRVRIDGGEPLAPSLREVDKPLLEHAWARAKIASVLGRAEGAKDESAHARVVELSTRYRILSPYTSLLVLETDWDYARFKIDRKAPGDLLAIRGTRVVLEARGEAQRPSGTSASAKGRAETETRRDRAEGKNDDADLRDDKASTMEQEAPKKEAPMDLAMGSAAAASPSSAAATSPSPAAATPPSHAAAAPMRRMVPRAARPRMLMARGSGGESDESDGQSARTPSAMIERADEWSREKRRAKVNPYTGSFRQVMDAIGNKEPKLALDTATRWHHDAPGDVMALVALGEALEANGDLPRAARSYGSLIDLFPSRADLRRFAGERLERMQAPGALELAVDTYGKAKDERPDHPASHRLLAFARLRKGDYEGAFTAAAAGIKQRYPEGRFAGVTRILREDLGLIAAAWIRARPDNKSDIERRLREAGGTLEEQPSLRFVLNWETDANDVDFHIFDAKGGHAYYSNPRLSSGGDLYADVTTGYGPECFTIRAPKGSRAAPYKLQAHYYSRGPMGYGMGKLEILDHDGRGNISFEERPFVVMVDGAFVDLGTVK